MSGILLKMKPTFYAKDPPRLDRINFARSRCFYNYLPDFDVANKDNFEIPTTSLVTEINNMIDVIKTNQKPVELNAEDGVYLGTAGISYMFYYLSKIPTLQDARTNYLNDAVEYIQPSLVVAQKYANKKTDVPSFILGNCGVYAVASAVYKAVGDDKRSEFFKKLYYDAATTCKEEQFLSCGSDELFVGRAGYICGALWLAKEIKSDPPIQDLHEICKVMITSGRKYAELHQSPCPLMYAYYGTEYLGAAHGLCSILQILLMVPEYLDANPGDAKDVKTCVDYLVGIQDFEGNFATSTDDKGPRHELVHWCHGAPGMIHLMAKAYLVWQEDKYLKSCLEMASLIWRKGLLRKGPGICHGIAGNGYAFLVLYRLTNDVKYLHRAVKFAQFMEEEEFRKKTRIPDRPYSLFEGLAGTVCFLADLTVPDRAAFPFLDVF